LGQVLTGLPHGRLWLFPYARRRDGKAWVQLRYHSRKSGGMALARAVPSLSIEKVVAVSQSLADPSRSLAFCVPEKVQQEHPWPGKGKCAGYVFERGAEQR
jgi:hypothetical protein